MASPPVTNDDGANQVRFPGVPQQNRKGEMPLPAPRSIRSLRLTMLVVALATALVGAAFAPAPVTAVVPNLVESDGGRAGAAAPLKAVVIVGPSHSSTSTFLSRGEAVAKVAESYGMDVRRVFHPRATAARVLANIQGANVVAYFGHGNGWPSPYAPFQERTKNGFGLNPYEGASASEVAYSGANWIRNNVRLASNAVVLLSNACYTSGNGESGMAIPSWDVAHQRVDNFAAGFLAVGAGAVFAFMRQDIGSVITMLHTTNKTVDEMFMTKMTNGFVGWNNRRLDSVRTPGMVNHLDPSSTAGFQRAVSGRLSMTAGDWANGALPPNTDEPPAVGPTVPQGLTAVAQDNRVVQLSWQASTSTVFGAMKYRVFRNGNAIGTQQTALTYTDQPAKTGTFSYQVRAIDAAGNKSDLSPIVNVQVVEQAGSSSGGSSTPAASGPTVPQGLTGTAHDNFVIVLSWQPSTSSVSGTMRYRVFRNGTAIGTQQTALTFTDQRSKANTFKYQVRAIDAAGNKSELSPAITVSSVKYASTSGGSSAATTPDTTPPSVPQGLKTEPLGYRYILITWQPSTDDRAGTIRYRVFRNGVAIGTKQTALSFTDRPSSAGTFRYQVRAIDAAGNKSALSPVVNGQAIKGPL